MSRRHSITGGRARRFAKCCCRWPCIAAYRPASTACASRARRLPRSIRRSRGNTHVVSARTPQEQLVLDFFRVLSSGDLEAIRATLHPDATWRPMVEGVPGAGVHGPRDKIVDEFLAPVRGLFVPGDPKTTVERMVSTGDTVMCESRGRGTLRDGRRYDNRYAWSIDVRDGRIFAIREYMDSHYVSTLFGGSACLCTAVAAADERSLRLRDPPRLDHPLRPAHPT